MITAILTTFVVTLLAVYAGWWARGYTLRHRPQPEIRGDKRCSICQVALAKVSYRTSSGYWRCPEHKGVR